MRKTLHRIDERGVCEIPDYEYIKKNSPVNLNRCDSILLSGSIQPVPTPSGSSDIDMGDNEFLIGG